MIANLKKLSATSTKLNSKEIKAIPSISNSLEDPKRKEITFLLTYQRKRYFFLPPPSSNISSKYKQNGKQSMPIKNI